jgi:SAM-dependent methyltransferase
MVFDPRRRKHGSEMNGSDMSGSEMSLKRKAIRWLWPFVPGYPDDGRRIVQGPHLRALLASAAKNSPDFPRVFNAGAGEGGYTRFLLDLPKVRSLVETDFGWRSQGPPQVDPRQVFFCSSLVSIPVTDQSFDLILCTEVLEHISEHELALDELARVAAPGSWLLITVPTPPAVGDPAHVREGYRAAELGALLTKRGYELVDTRYCMHFFFRFVLLNWPKARWSPRFLIWLLAYLDRICPLGPPMDLMMLARFTGPRVALNGRKSGSVGSLSRV